MRLALLAVCLFAGLGPVVTRAHGGGLDVKNPSPELVGDLTKKLSITPKQATGGAGALFGLAKTRLKPDEFSQVSKAVPGMDGFLEAAPKPKKKSGLSSLGSLGSAGSSLPGGLGDVASVADSFHSLGLSPGMAGKFVPILKQFVGSKGGSGVASLLGGALKGF
jgi:hypothetical protein